MATDRLRLGNAHNIFSKLGEVGIQARKSDRYHKRLVSEKVTELEKTGSTICYNEEQLRDIQAQTVYETEFERLEDEIEIKVKER